MNQTWLPFDLDTCPQNVPIIVWYKNTKLYGEVMALIVYSKRTWKSSFDGQIRTAYFFDPQRISGWKYECIFDEYNLPTHYMLAPQPPKE